MSRTYMHRYKVLSGPLQGLISDGRQIGCQDYIDQYEIENMSIEQRKAHMTAKCQQGLCDGIWLFEVNQALYRPVPLQGVRQRKTEFTDEGVNYDDVYMDLCVPFDRYNNEITVGDKLIIASKNEARRAVVTKIAKKPYFGNYGIVRRKLTVHDELENQTLTINDSFATIKV